MNIDIKYNYNYISEHEEYCNLYTSELLKEFGFDWECLCCYDLLLSKTKIRDNYSVYNHNKLSEFVSAPTLAVAQRWLRDVKGIHITIFSQSQESWMCRITEKGQKLEDGLYFEDFATYEQALECAISNTLERLKKLRIETEE